MGIEFATCERARALSFIQRVYPSSVITDSPNSAGPLLDLVERDIVRIQDPAMYGGNIEVSRNAANWDEKYLSAVIAACEVFHVAACNGGGPRRLRTGP